MTALAPTDAAVGAGVPCGLLGWAGGAARAAPRPCGEAGTSRGTPAPGFEAKAIAGGGEPLAARPRWPAVSDIAHRATL